MNRKNQNPHAEFRIKEPVFCLVVGVAGSGKTLLGESIVRLLENSAFISKDLIETPFTNKERHGGELYLMVKKPAFKILCDFADTQLRLGKIPVIDAPFSINHWRNDDLSDWVSPFRRVAKRNNARLAIVRCLPPGIEELKQRIRKRGYLWDRWKLKNWDEFLKREPLDFPIKHNDVYEIVTCKPSSECAIDVLKNFLHARKITGK